MVGPTVNELWLKRESKMREEANPFGFDIGGEEEEEEEPTTPDILLASSSSSGSLRIAGRFRETEEKQRPKRQSTPPPPRSGVLLTARDNVVNLDQLISNIKQEREGAYQRARSAIDRLGALSTQPSSSDLVSERQRDSDANHQRSSLPSRTVLCSDSASDSTATHQEQENRPTLLSASPMMPAKKKIAALPSCSNVKKEVQVGYTKQPQASQVEGKTQRSLENLFPASELPRCFAQSAAQLHERLISRGILATASHVAVCNATAAVHQIRSASTLLGVPSRDRRGLCCYFS